ncbi:MAG: phosphotransferase [Methylococcales bacterium]|jgi:N-acetylmuramate 1-kinase|nr:phosphotransferase [Methylococcales bacterium]MBT7444341.1 phosphotransferase [Methylococcales bacterium]
MNKGFFVDERLEQLTQWVKTVSGQPEFDIRPASGDASFRRYFRVTYPDNNTQIAMDSPPEKEKNPEFVKIAELFQQAGLHVPKILDRDMDRGFLLLSDLGNRQYLPELTELTVERLYGDAMGALASFQVCIHEADIPAYDHALLADEMHLFRDWYLKKEKGLELAEQQAVTLADGFEQLAQMALAQPSVCVHRDYHSRNLMICDLQTPGILDFQDAVQGPVTYDLVSLLKDCYISWPQKNILDWVKGYHELAIQSGIIVKETELETFIEWFEWMGVQRHLKAIGIFSRLKHRDEKPGYMNDIPRTMVYVLDVCSRYDALQPFHALLIELGCE